VVSTSASAPPSDSDALVSKEEIKFSTNLLSSSEFDNLMGEFNSLMAQVTPPPPEPEP
jgi:hypothetical protein